MIVYRSSQKNNLPNTAIAEIFLCLYIVKYDTRHTKIEAFQRWCTELADTLSAPQYIQDFLKNRPDFAAELNKNTNVTYDKSTESLTLHYDNAWNRRNALCQSNLDYTRETSVFLDAARKVIRTN